MRINLPRGVGYNYSYKHRVERCRWLLFIDRAAASLRFVICARRVLGPFCLTLSSLCLLSAVDSVIVVVVVVGVILSRPPC